MKGKDARYPIELFAFCTYLVQCLVELYCLMKNIRCFCKPFDQLSLLESLMNNLAAKIEWKQRPTINEDRWSGAFSSIFSSTSFVCNFMVNFWRFVSILNLSYILFWKVKFMNVRWYLWTSKSLFHFLIRIYIYIIEESKYYYAHAKILFCAF